MSFVAELQQRRVFRVATVYLVVAWVAIQAASIALPAFDAPPWTLRVLILLFALGFPLTLLLTWALQVTPEGITLATGQTGNKRMAAIVAGLIALALAWYFVGQPAMRARDVARMPERSIAVLPFVNMSGDPANDYFSDGLAETTLDMLAQVRNLKVIARTSSFAFKGKEVDVATIAKALNVANVLEGSVRKSGNTLRITAQLIRASDSSHLWSQTYDRQLTDVFKVQDEIAAAVVDALKVKLLPKQSFANRPRSRNTEAYDQYLIGNQFNLRANLENWQRASAAYRRAIALDPGFAPAYAALAGSLGGLADAQGDAAGMALSLQNAETAIRLAPDLPDGGGALNAALSLARQGKKNEARTAMDHGESGAVL
mgnify:CR=1 FL=1